MTPGRRFALAITLSSWLVVSRGAYSFSTPTPRSRVFVGTPVKSPQRCVGDCMTAQPFTFRATTSVDEAIASLLRLGVSGAPVVDGHDKLIGVISTSDFLNKELGGAILPMEGSRETVEGYLEAAKKIVGQRVGDMMTEDPVTIGPNESMKEAAAVMANCRLHRVLVVDDEGKLLGILTRSDVMRDVLKIVRGALPEAEEDQDSVSPDDAAP